MNTWQTVKGPGGTHQLTDDDFVWAVKATHHESTRNPVEWAAVLWTMLNRYMSGRAVGRRGLQTWGSWIRTFSSTVNPKWVEECRGDEDASRCVERQAWVAANIARPYSWYVEHDPELVNFVAAFFRGSIPAGQFTGLTDFAAKYVGHGPEDVPWNTHIAGLPSNSNAFYKATWSLDWNEDTVRIGASRWKRAARAVLGLGLGAVLAGVVIGAARKRRPRRGGR